MVLVLLLLREKFCATAAVQAYISAVENYFDFDFSSAAESPR